MTLEGMILTRMNYCAPGNIRRYRSIASCSMPSAMLHVDAVAESVTPVPPGMLMVAVAVQLASTACALLWAPNTVAWLTFRSFMVTPWVDAND